MAVGLVAGVCPRSWARRHDDHHRVALRPVAVVRMKMTWVDACALAILRQALFSLMLAAA